MYTFYSLQSRRVWTRKLIAGAGLLLAASATSCKQPGYRTEVYPGQQGQYSVQHIAEAPRSTESAAVTQVPAAAPAPAAVNAAPADDNLRQVEAIWPKLSDSDKALLAETAKHLAAQR